MGAGPIEIAVADGDITLNDTRADRCFMKMARVGQDRDVGKFVETDIVFNEVEFYEGGVLCPPLLGQKTVVA